MLPGSCGARCRPSALPRQHLARRARRGHPLALSGTWAVATRSRRRDRSTATVISAPGRRGRCAAGRAHRSRGNAPSTSVAESAAVMKRIEISASTTLLDARPPDSGPRTGSRPASGVSAAPAARLAPPSSSRWMPAPLTAASHSTVIPEDATRASSMGSCSERPRGTRATKVRATGLHELIQAQETASSHPSPRCRCSVRSASSSSAAVCVWVRERGCARRLPKAAMLAGPDPRRVPGCPGPGRRRGRQWSPEEKWEVFFEATSGALSQADVAHKWQVDVATVIEIRRLAKDAALAAFVASKPARPGSPSEAWSPPRESRPSRHRASERSPRVAGAPLGAHR